MDGHWRVRKAAICSIKRPAHGQNRRDIMSVLCDCNSRRVDQFDLRAQAAFPKGIFQICYDKPQERGPKVKLKTVFQLQVIGGLFII